MASIQQFEEIVAWQEARKLVKMIYTVTQQAGFRHDRVLAEQAQRAAVSVMSNIAEGFDADSRVEFGRFLGYARRSASEIQSLLYVALDQQYVDQEAFGQLYDHAEKVRRMVTAFMTYLRQTPTRMKRFTRPYAGTSHALTRSRVHAITQ